MASDSHSTSSIKTYHCLCSHLLFATTHHIPHLPQRSSTSLDRAHILPCPPVSSGVQSAILSESTRSPSPPHDQDAVSSRTSDGITVLLSVPIAPQPTIIRKGDGFEKRYMLKCGRCKITVGYQLDSAQWRGDGMAGGRKGRRNDVAYILPNGVMETKDLLEGKKMREKDVRLGVEVE